MHSHTTIIGHLGQDAQTRTLEGGRVVTSFSVAHTETWKDQRGEKQERTQWFNCSYFTQQHPAVAAYLTRGALVCVTGKVSARAYLDSRNQPAASLDLNVDTIRLLGPRRDEQAAPAAPEQQQATPPATTATQTPPADGDDLPF